MTSVAPDTDTPVHGLFSPEGVRLELPVAGPAPRMLPALPLKIVDKKLVVAGPFTERIYFEKD